MTLRKSDPVNVEYEAKAKNILKGEMKRRGVTYAQLAELLSEKGIQENERNLNNKVSRGGFSAAFMILCLESIGCSDIRF
jgi:3-mercaptopyruvate sulfurtransferase SseA